MTGESEVGVRGMTKGRKQQKSLSKPMSMPMFIIKYSQDTLGGGMPYIRLSQKEAGTGKFRAAAQGEGRPIEGRNPLR